MTTATKKPAATVRTYALKQDRSIRIEAIRWDGNNIGEIRAFLVRRTVNLSNESTYGKHLQVVPRGNDCQLNVSKGNYVCKRPDGIIWAVCSETFRHEYELMRVRRPRQPRSVQ